jgi:hypothetical protein
MKNKGISLKFAPIFLSFIILISCEKKNETSIEVPFDHSRIPGTYHACCLVYTLIFDPSHEYGYELEIIPEGGCSDDVFFPIEVIQSGNKSYTFKIKHTDPHLPKQFTAKIVDYHVDTILFDLLQYNASIDLEVDGPFTNEFHTYYDHGCYIDTFYHSGGLFYYYPDLNDMPQMFYELEFRRLSKKEIIKIFGDFRSQK